MRTVFLLIIVALLSGCSTPYQRLGLLGGYEDGHIKDNIYYVNVQVNGVTSQETAAQYLHRRAKEVCLENGYQEYKVYGERNTSSTGIAGGVSIRRPGIAGYVECMRK